MTKSVIPMNNSLDYLWSIRDQRLDDWFLMSSPWPTVCICLAYVLFVTVLGPRLMKDREALDLKGTIMAYNLFQVFLSAYVVYESWMAGWGTHYSWICQDVERDPDPNGSGMRMARITWIYFLSKFLEFCDTFFFLARKKFAHVSALQVTHHGIMPIFGYIMTRWYPGGHESFGGFLNSIVHVIMYGYYFCAALGPQFQKYLWWKKYLTTFQMFQFMVLFLKSQVVIFGIAECGYPWQFSLFCSSIMVLFLILFAGFYQQEYQAKQKRKLLGGQEKRHLNATKLD
uniref:Elongation of very long chain fatty acids protein n=1 Tax=Platychelipus littoralis TaxID=2593136 RepID=A0A9E8RU54_9MAXI|nr:fatty acid elongase elovl1e [Platychelipus littoralis]